MSKIELTIEQVEEAQGPGAIGKRFDGAGAEAAHRVGDARADAPL